MKFSIKHLILGLSLICGTLCAEAGPADSLAMAADKAPSNAALNFKAGRALYEAGKNAKARTYLSRGGNEALPWLALVNFEDYNFDMAEQLAGKYLESKHDASSAEHRLATDVTGRVTLARTMLDRVEKVQVIDSLVVPRDKFFKSFGISPTTGRVESASALPSRMKAADPTTVYVSENGDRMLWGATDDNGNVHIVESSHLADGSWEGPHAIGDELQLGANANYPFLLADGVTLYYASDGEGSLGGYDIYITRNDGDRYLNPQNIGMPYNSPMDDYLLAIDETTGAGWWATDRNLIPDSLTIYVFVPQELRDNYPVDGTPDLIDRARISSIAATQKPGADYQSIRNAIAQLAKEQSADAGSAAEFAFSLPDGRVVTAIDNFIEPEARDLMQEYLSVQKEYAARLADLERLRRDYGKGNKALAQDILDGESELDQMREQLHSMKNEIVKAEIRD